MYFENAACVTMYTLQKNAAYFATRVSYSCKFLWEFPLKDLFLWFFSVLTLYFIPVLGPIL